MKSINTSKKKGKTFYRMSINGFSVNAHTAKSLALPELPGTASQSLVGITVRPDE